MLRGCAIRYTRVYFSTFTAYMVGLVTKDGLQDHHTSGADFHYAPSITAATYEGRAVCER